VLAGLKGPAGVDGFPTDAVVMKPLTLRGVRAVDRDSFRRAIATIEACRLRLDRLHTHHVPLRAAADAIGLLAEAGSGAIAVTVEP
jgi:threonine dehydrogenase-like Zn-dependent dehydrogenase